LRQTELTAQLWKDRGLIGYSTSVTTWRNDRRVLQPGRFRVEVWELAGLAFIRITSPRPGDASLRPIGDARTSCTAALSRLLTRKLVRSVNNRLRRHVTGQSGEKRTIKWSYLAYSIA
jgi:hypothetical protein